MLPLAHLRRAHAGSPVAAQTAQTVNISPTVIVEIYGGGGNYADAVQGDPFAINLGGDLAAANPASDTTEIVVEASHCDRNELPPPAYKIYRSFIEYDTSALTGTVTSARLIFTNEEPFTHDGNGRAIHDLMIHQGTWTSTADITPTIVASTTFQAWYSSTLANINFGPITAYPYLAELDIDPLAVISGGTTRLVFRTSAESMVGPLAGSCDLIHGGSGLTAVGNRFTAPLLEITYAADGGGNTVYLPLIIKN
jgi:hypothetical protein